jgi:hypothetical protein
MVIEPARWADWLDPAMTNRADLLALLAPAMAGGLVSVPVSTAVNAVRNNGPALIEPLAPGPGDELVAGSNAKGGAGPPPPGLAVTSEHAAGPPPGRAGAGRHPRDGDRHRHSATAPLTLF